MDKTRSLGLDIGDKRIGVAMCDPDGILASPLTIINRVDDEELDIKVITDIINQYQVGRVIVGLPLSMDGSIGNQAEKVTTFTQRLTQHTEVPVLFRDERLTTVTAQRLMKTASKKTRQKARDDAIAAAIILQRYLEEGRSEPLD